MVKMAHSQSESSILYHVVQMDQSESRKKNLHKKDVKTTQKSANKRTTTEVKFKFVYCHEYLGYRRGHVSRQVRTRLSHHGPIDECFDENDECAWEPRCSHSRLDQSHSKTHFAFCHSHWLWKTVKRGLKKGLEEGVKQWLDF